MRSPNIFWNLIFFLAVLTTAIPLAGAEGIRVTSTFDKRSVQVDEEVHLIIKITGSSGSVQAPRLPAFKGFETYYTGRTSNITFIGGQSSSTVEFSYLLVPKTAGRYTLDPIEVTVDNRLFRTDPITVEVLASQGQMTRPQPQAPAQPLPPQQTSSSQTPAAQPPAVKSGQGDDNIFIQAWMDKPSAYPNEQVLLTYSLYTRYDTRYEGFETEPSISGFWIEEFPMEKDIPRETVHVSGKRYVKADIRKIALFPTAAAEYTIQPGSLKISIRREPDRTSIFDDFFNDSFFSGGGFFSRRENLLLKPAPIHLSVKPLPETGKPASYQGAVGQFRLSASLDKQEVKQNEPVTLKLVIEGEGNVETLNKPEIPDLPDFKVYESDTSTDLFKSGSVIGGRKSFEIVFIPRRAGDLTIPSFEFSFFNPLKKSYEIRRTNEFSVKASPSDQVFQLPESVRGEEIFKKDVQAEGRDIRYIMEKLPGEVPDKFLSHGVAGFLAADILLTLICLAGIFQARRETLFAKDSALKRRRLAKSSALVRMRRLKSVSRLKADDAGGYFEEVDKILTQYLADKFNLSIYGGTRQDFERQIGETLGVGDPLYRDIMDLYLFCDESRFGKGSVNEDLARRALRTLKLTIQRVEKIRR